MYIGSPGGENSRGSLSSSPKSVSVPYTVHPNISPVDRSFPGMHFANVK